MKEEVKPMVLKSRQRAKAKAKKKSKYKAKGERIDGRYFSSAAEAERYRQLKKLESDGAIEGLECQPRFNIVVNNVKICAYVADFRYLVLDDRGSAVRTVIEDVKGMMMPVYKLKKKLVEAVYPFEIVEIPSRKIAQWADRVG